MSTIPTDVSTELNRDDAAAAFLERWKDPKEVSKDDEGAEGEDNEETVVEEPDTTETDEDPSAEEANEDPSDDTNEDGEGKPDEPKKPAKAANDDDEVAFTVDGVEHKASVKELKRLAGQEASLTRKSQDAAEKTKVAEELRIHHITALNTLVQKAEDAYKPYADLDWLVASREMSPEDLQAVRAEANSAWQNYKFLTEELGGAVKQQQESQQQVHSQAAHECIKALESPETGIKGYDQKMYTEMCSYAISEGMKPERVYTITDPQAFKLIHKAMAYDKIQKVATQKKATSVKTALKSTSATTTQKPQSSANAKSAMKKLAASGSRQDAANALMERWKQDD